MNKWTALAVGAAIGVGLAYLRMKQSGSGS